MTKRQLSLFLAIGIVGGLFVTACAGVAAGKVDMPAAGDLFGVGPAIHMESLPSIELPRPAQSATFMFEKAVPNIYSDPETVRLNNAIVQAGAESLIQDQAQTQMQFQHGLCSRGGH